MPIASTFDEQQGAALKEALTSLATRLAPADIEDSRWQDAFEAIDRALVATIRYTKGREAGKPQNEGSEGKLTSLWLTASEKLSAIGDPEVTKIANACAPESWQRSGSECRGP